MMKYVYEFFLYLFTLYGLISIIMCFVDAFKSYSPKKGNVKIAFMVKDQQECIEYIVKRAILLQEEHLMFENASIAFVDMGSTDDTYKILLKIKNDFDCIEVFGFDEKDEIFK